MRFTSEPVEEHVDVPVADDGRLDDLIAHWGQREKGESVANPQRNKCFVLSVSESADDVVRRAQLSEIVRLVDAQGDLVIGSEAYRNDRIDPRTWVGRGTAAQIGQTAVRMGANMLVVDAELSPSQTRNLEEATGLPVCDREAVILNVFERHARTPRARIQVEIAHLQYLRPRIHGIGLNMDQQAGGIMGSRGTGETASELFARRLDHRLAHLRRQLEKLKHSDRLQRKRRQSCERIALVGYTNAGKTSLMNALTDAGLSVRDRPFETLETTSRCLTRHGGDVLLTDTVGFIRRLPDRLFASFESTLAELGEATLVVIVVDLSDPERKAQLVETRRVLHRLGADQIPSHVVFNKLDLLDSLPCGRELRSLALGARYSVVSSVDELAITTLRTTLIDRVRSKHVTQEMFIPYEHQPQFPDLYVKCRVLEAHANDAGTRFVVEGESYVVRAINRRLAEVES